MFRVGITAYLMVATLAGPALCCCTMERMTAFAFDTVFSARSDKTASHCCCATTCTNSSHKDGQQPHEPGKCPCKEKGNSRTAMPTVERVEVSQNNLTAEFFAQAAAVTLGVELPTAHISFVQEQSKPVHIFGQDILLAFQTFRC